MHKKHLLWMLIGCTIPLLLIFIAPALGLGGNTGLLIFIAAMFACHLFMPHGHGGHRGHDEHDHSPHQKEEHYERH
ncbi:MAG: hypothetical protein ACE5FF_03610 [Saprospiraceae bacterium]